MQINYFIGLDLGQAGDFTALAVLERTLADGLCDSRPWSWHYALRHLERFPPGTPYITVMAWLWPRTEKPPLQGATLVLDQTGVGRPVADAFRRAALPVEFRAAVLTAGHAHTYADSAYHVPKRELASVLQLVLQERRLKIAGQLPQAPTLVQELEAFRPRVRLTQEEAEDWRERPHDGLVFATALPLWLAERDSPGPPALPLVVGTPPAWWRGSLGWRRAFA
jgi:hypothetical protein